MSVCKSISRTHSDRMRNHPYYKFGGMEHSEDIVHNSFLKWCFKCGASVVVSPKKIIEVKQKPNYRFPINYNKVCYKGLVLLN